MEQILDILYTVPNPWVILPVWVVVFIIPGLIAGFCFKSVRRVEVVYAWTFAGPVIATLIAGLVIHLFVSPFVEGKAEELALLSLKIGIPCGWALGLMFPMVTYLLIDSKIRKKMLHSQQIHFVRNNIELENHKIIKNPLNLWKP
jgi:hypothetical protein